MVSKLVILFAVIAVAVARPGFLAESPISYASHYGSHYYGGDYDYGHTHHVIPPAVSYQSSTVYHTKPVVTKIVAPVVKTIATPVITVPHYAGYDGIHSGYDGIHTAYDGHGLYGGYGGYGGWKGWY